MRYNIQQTSLEAYLGLKENGKLNKYQQKVFDFVDRRLGVTDKEISVGVNLPINCVTARRHELVNMGLVVSSGKRPCAITKINVMEWITI